MPPKQTKPAGPSGHRRFGSSNSKQWLTCAGSIALTEALPPAERKRSDTIWSRRGTAAHAVGEMCLIGHQNDPLHATSPEDYLGQTVEGVVVDEEIVEGCNVYVDWAKAVMADADHVALESSYDMIEFIRRVQGEGQYLLLTETDYGGTGDFTAMKLWGRLTIGDYKNGRGYVDVVNNTQLLIYALCALIKYGEEYEFDEVAMVIIQPNGPGDKIREWVVTPEEVWQWAREVFLPGSERAVEAINALRAGMSAAEFAERYLVADLQGHCHFCPAKARCTAACNSACDNALVEFVEVMDCGADELDLVLPDLALISAEQEQLILDNAEGILAFIRAVQERAHARAERGEDVIGHKLVAKTGGRRKLVSTDEVVKAECKRMGLVPHEYMEAPGLKSVAQLEKAFKAKGVTPERIKAFLDKHAVKNDAGVALVKITDPRPAIAPAIDAEFADLIDKQDDLLDL